MGQPRKWSLSPVIVICGIVALTFMLFWPSVRFGFIGYDDPEYVSRNPHVLGGLTWENVRWALVSTHASNWHPLTWLSHMADIQMFGLRPGYHHLTNTLLHSLNAALIFVVLRLLTGAIWRSALVAALFALHPCHVESVAWISERKDVLSTLFGLLAMWGYALYCGRRNTAPNALSSARMWYGAALLFFALSLASKPMLVTLPFVLLLLDHWPLGRLIKAGKSRGCRPELQWRVVLEKVPFLMLSLGSSIVTFVAQRAGGAVETLERVPWSTRVVNAMVGYCVYLKHLVWPRDLAILYLRPPSWPLWVAVGSALGLLLMTGVVFHRRAPQAYLLIGWLWFVGTLVPVIGLVQVGNQYMADRYTYFPYIGLFLIIVWGGCDLLSALKSPKWLPAAIAICALAGLGAVTTSQLRYWRNTETLFNHCIAVTPNNFVAHNILAASLDSKSRFAEAKAHFEEALKIEPGYVDALRNLGVLLTDHGDYGEALDDLERAVAGHPGLSSVFAKLGLMLDNENRAAAAIRYYRKALEYNPDDLTALNNLAWILATHPDGGLRNGREAVTLARRACDLTHDQQAPLLGTLAAAYAEAGDFEQAARSCEKAISLAEAAGQTSVRDRNRELLELFRAQKPYR
jgi:Flp pilus assembly protein TadD